MMFEEEAVTMAPASVLGTRQGLNNTAVTARLEGSRKDSGKRATHQCIQVMEHFGARPDVPICVVPS